MEIFIIKEGVIVFVMMFTSIFSPREVITDIAGDDGYDDGDEGDILLVKMSSDAFTPVSVCLSVLSNLLFPVCSFTMSCSTLLYSTQHPFLLMP